MTTRCMEGRMMITFLKDRLAWLRSFVQSRPVITHRDVAVQLPEPTTQERVRKPGLACYIPREELEFILEGTTRIGDRVVYRLYHPQTQKTISLSEEVFKLLFKLK